MKARLIPRLRSIQNNIPYMLQLSFIEAYTKGDVEWVYFENKSTPE